MEVRRMFWWEHESCTPAATAAEVFRSVRITEKKGRPTCFEDYDIHVEEMEAVVKPEIVKQSTPFQSYRVHGANGKRSENHQLFAPERMLLFTCLPSTKEQQMRDLRNIVNTRPIYARKLSNFAVVPHKRDVGLNWGNYNRAKTEYSRSSQEGRGFEYS